MKNIHVLVIVLTLFVICSLNNLSLAEDVVILGNNNKPPKIWDENGNSKGILVDILRYAEQEMNTSLSVQLYPWAKAYNDAVEGRGGIIGLSMTQERLEIFDYSEVVFYDEVVLVVLKDHEFPFETVADLQGKRIGIGRGGSFGDEFEQAKADGVFTVSEDDGPVYSLKKLLRGRIDAAFISPGKAGVAEVIRQDEELLQHKQEFTVLPKPFKLDPNYLGFAKQMKMQEFLKTFNDVIKKGYDAGEIQKIIDRYGE